MPQNRRGGKGRKPLEIKPGFGEAIYKLMKLQYKSDSLTEWKPPDLAAAMTEVMDKPVAVDAIRRWIGGAPPHAWRLLPLARILGTTTDDLLLAHETADISHISALPEQLRTSTLERTRAVVKTPEKQKRKKGKSG